MVSNITNINKTNNHLSLQLIEHKKGPQHIRNSDPDICPLLTKRNC